MRILVPIIAILLLLSCGTSKVATKSQGDFVPRALPKTAAKPLAEDTQRLFQQDNYEIEGYLLSTARDTSKKSFGGYKVMQHVQNLIHADTIRNILRNERSFLVDNGTYKSCAFSPQVGLRITHNDRNCSVLLDYQCYVLHIIDEDGNTISRDFDPSQKRLMNFGKLTFDDLFTTAVNR
jgi:hypothetical protein